MLSVIIPTQGMESPVVATLAALVPGAAAGLIRDVILVDRSGSAIIERVADIAGCEFFAHEGSQASALHAGVERTNSPWLMFLHAGAVLDHGWIDETAQFIQAVESSGRQRAGVFRHARSPYGESRIKDGVKLLTRFVAGPHSDQGLIIARDHYDKLGGYTQNSRRPEARLLSKIGRTGRALLRTKIYIAA